MCFGRGGPHSIQSNQVGPQPPRLRGGVRGRGRAAASQRRPSLPLFPSNLAAAPAPAPKFLPFPCQDPSNSAPPLFLSPPSPRLLATESAGRQIHPLPPWSKEAGRHRLPSKGLGCQPTLAASPQFLFHLQLLRPSTARARRTSTGQGRAEQITDTSSSSKSLAESD